MEVQAPNAHFLKGAWDAVSSAAAKSGVAVILGTERIVDAGLVATALVVNPNGTVAGFQDKVQIDPSEELTYADGSGRRFSAHVRKHLES
jgi:predicted amidohydrolase